MFTVAVVVEAVKLAGSLQRSITEYNTVGSFHFSCDAVHLVSIAFYVIH
jgi:hypothetical protein